MSRSTTPDGNEIRVLLVDDSPTVRAVLRRMLRRHPDLEIVGEAEDGEAGVHLATTLRPDVVLMDIAMPKVDGFTATREIMARAPTAILVFSTGVELGGRRTIFEACSRQGARTALPKPASPEAWTELAETLPELVKNVARDFKAGAASRAASAFELPDLERLTAEVSCQPLRYLAIGASTGGPEALYQLLQGLARPPLPVLVVQHIAAEFEQGLVDWLASDLGLDIRLAHHGERPQPGTVRLAPQGFHLRLRDDGRLALDGLTPPVGSHRPSADVLLGSCAEVDGPRVAGVLLSGMGRDGVDGLQALRKAGGLTLVQDRPSSVIYGMPQAALDAGAAELALSPEKIAAYLLKLCKPDGGRE